MKIPKKCSSQIDPGTPDSTLRALAKEFNVPFDDLWYLRHRLKIRWNR